MQTINQPHLFGLKNSNRDFTQKRAWGKNQFNSSFPASLSCYLHNQGYKANYLSLHNGLFSHADIYVSDIFGINPLDNDIYFAFESIHTPFQQYVIGSLPRTDLVIQRKSTGHCLTGLEIKLTALPDNTTCNLTEEEYGSEIVVRPDTIVYLACSIAQNLGNKLDKLIPSNLHINDWTEPYYVLPHISAILSTLQLIYSNLEDTQKPFLLQPIWKTLGKSPLLAEHCFDIFAWSDAGFTYFITQISNDNPEADRITRQTRTAIWLFKMLLDIKNNGRFNHRKIIDELSYNTKNDKAFASSGNITNRFMSCQRTKKPIITKTELKNIILGGGQNLLSPERRLDAIIYNSPELFK